jgi:hypothetical protein
MDETGQVIGVATLVSAEGQNLNFAIPVEKVPAGLVQLPSEQLVASAQPTATPTPEPTPTWTLDPEPTRATLMSPDDYALVTTNQKLKEWYALYPNTPLTVGEAEEWFDKAKEWYADKVKEWYALHPNTPLTAEKIWEWADKDHLHPNEKQTNQSKRYRLAPLAKRRP